jgi:hypothetical protein
VRATGRESEFPPTEDLIALGIFNGLWKDYQAVLEGFDLEKHFENVIPVETNREKRCCDC